MTATSETAMIAELVADLLGSEERSAAARRQAPGEDPALWLRLEEFGLTLAGVAEDKGGAGVPVGDVLTVFRVAGAHALALPLLETGIAAWLLAEADLPIPSGPLALAPAGFDDRIVARGSGDGAVLDGTSHGTPAMAGAARLVVAALDESSEPVVAVVDPAAVESVPLTDVSGGARELLRFRQTPALVSSVAASAAPEQVLRRAALGRCAMIVGALGAVRDMTVEFTRGRTQFGRPLIKFQAVAQQLAVIARECALTEAATRGATEALVADGEAPLLEVAAAKVVCGRAAATVARTAHQLHGAIGITSEHPLGRFTGRLLVWRGDFGGERAWAAALGRELVGADPWPRLSATGHLRLPRRGAATG
jgi:acyl-CoA dehydrogenase